MTVLVGYKSSREGDAAFDAALREASVHRERLVLVNSPHGGAPVDAALATEDDVRGFTERAAAAGVELEIRQTPHTDDLVEALVATAEEVGASVIVIGLRRRSPVGKLIMGSTAQQILLRADVPVLAVKPVRA
jgi:nucleotide-binding universal stress UspA family protein